MTETNNNSPALVVAVDDEPSILNSLKRTLDAVNCELHCFEDAREALDFCRKNQPSLVISDMRMPAMDGLEFLGILATEMPMIERVLLTGYSDMDTTISAINKGKINYYIEKPWKDVHLVEVVNKSIDVFTVRVRNHYLEQLTRQQNEELRQWNEKLENRVQERTLQLRNAYTTSVQTFSSLVNRRMKGHASASHEIAAVVLATAKSLDLSENTIRDLIYAAFLCNIGKVGFTDELLDTPYIKLSQEQRETFHRHPLLAEAAISLLPPLQGATKILNQHKERLDGSGFPNCLTDTDITQEALLLGLVTEYYECCDGLLMDHSLTHNEAIEHLQQISGEAYPEDLTNAVLQQLEAQHAEDPLLNETCLRPHKLEPGMVLTKDLFSDNGALLLTRASLIDEHAIDALRTMEAHLNHELNIYVIG